MHSSELDSTSIRLKGRNLGWKKGEIGENATQEVSGLTSGWMWDAEGVVALGSPMICTDAPAYNLKMGEIDGQHG